MAKNGWEESQRVERVDSDRMTEVDVQSVAFPTWSGESLFLPHLEW